MAYDFGRGATGAGTGAIYGAQLGGAPGALGGAALGAFGGFFGDKKKKKKLSTFDPQQHQLYNQSAQALQGGGGPLADVYGQFNPELMRDYYERSYAQPAYREFQKNVVPTITGQFRGQNLQNSSYLGGALAEAGSNVQNNLNSQISRMIYEGQQANANRRERGIEGILNRNTFDYEQNQPSVFDSLLNSITGQAGKMLGDFDYGKFRGGGQIGDYNRSKSPSTQPVVAAGG